MNGAEFTNRTQVGSNPIAVPNSYSDGGNVVLATEGAAAEVTAAYEQYQKAVRDYQDILAYSPSQLAAAQTAYEKVETALWLFESAVQKHGHELSDESLAFYNQVIELASAASSTASFVSASEEDGMSMSSTSSSTTNTTTTSTATKNHRDAYEEALLRESGFAKIQLMIMLLLTPLGKSIEAIRSMFAKLTSTYTGDNGSGSTVDFRTLIDMLDDIIITNDGKTGVPAEGIFKDKDGKNIVFKDKASTEQWIAEKFGSIARAKEEPPGSGKWVAMFDIAEVHELKDLCEKMEQKQIDNGGFLSPEEYASLEAAFRGIFAGWDGKVSTVSQMSGQNQQAFDTFAKSMSTMLSNEIDESSRILSRL